MAIEPLILPEKYRFLNSFQQFIRDVPIFGTWAQMRRHFRSIVRKRTYASLFEWGASVEIYRCLCVVSPLVQEYFGWANVFFVPDDPCRYLLWDPSMQMLDCEFMTVLSRQLSLPDDFFDGCDILTYGQFIQKIVDHLHSSNPIMP